MTDQELNRLENTIDQREFRDDSIKAFEAIMEECRRARAEADSLRGLRMTDEVADRIAKRLNAAFGRIWQYDVFTVWTEDGDVPIADCPPHALVTSEYREANGHFIANAPEDIAALLADRIYLRNLAHDRSLDSDVAQNAVMRERDRCAAIAARLEKASEEGEGAFSQGALVTAISIRSSILLGKWREGSGEEA